MAYAWSIGYDILNLEFSPIKGPEGNIEYLLYLQNYGEILEREQEVPVYPQEINPAAIVEEAHNTLD